MRIFGLLSIVIVLAILLLQYQSGIKGTVGGEAATGISKSVENQVNSSVSDYQKKLEESMEQSDGQ